MIANTQKDLDKVKKIVTHLSETKNSGDLENSPERVTSAIVLDMIKRNPKPFIQNPDLDTLILGCTHFPILADIIGDILGKRITLIDPGRGKESEILRLGKQSQALAGDAEDFWSGKETDVYADCR